MSKRAYNHPVYKAAREAARTRIIRGGVVCYLCGEGVGIGGGGQGGRGSTPRGGEGWSLDHRVPLALGGTNDPTNLDIVHARCNSRDGGVLSGWLRRTKQRSSRRRGRERSTKFNR